MAERHGVADYGVGQLGSVEFCTYTASHGITPGVAVVHCHPTPQFRPAQGQVLTISDGIGTIKIPRCRIDDVQEIRGEQGVYLELRLRDRRWQWLELGSINGCYNQLDPHAKLIPWTVRSPHQLAVLCLEAMGEKGYTIDMPPGLAGPINTPDFIPVGQNLPPTGTNPPINWVAEPPIQALQRLCDLFGRRIVYDWESDTINVVIPGFGADLPDGSISRQSPGLHIAPKPDVVAVVGSPTKFQGRFLLQAVGKEWDGSYRPINALSYAPQFVGAKQVVNVVVKNAPASGTMSWRVHINYVQFEVEAAGLTNLQVVQQLAAKINASTSPRVKPYVIASTSGTDTLVITGKKVGESFIVGPEMSTNGNSPNPWPSINAKEQQAAAPAGGGWQFCPPPLFPTVRATDRLTYRQAVALAQESVWKCYRLINLDVSGRGTIFVPGYGRVARQQQIVLHDTMVDQIVPAEADKTFLDRAGFPLVVNYYNGYSRDKPARVLGSVSIFLQHAAYVRDKGLVTQPTDQVHVPFGIDPVYQLVVFSDYVYTFDPTQLGNAALLNAALSLTFGFNFVGDNPVFQGRIVEPRLVLETGCNVRHPLTNQLVSYASAGVTPGRPNGTDAKVTHRPDVQLNVTAEYNDNGTVKKVSLLEADAVVRANYYVQGETLQYPNSIAETRTYNGIVPVRLDGAISQVTWEVGPSGPTTIASRNTEHQVYVAPYPERRRAELLPPAQVKKIIEKIDPQRQGDHLMRGGRDLSNIPASEPR